MQIDLVKMFPISCSEMGITSLQANTSDIEEFGIDPSSNPVSHVVVIGEIKYKFLTVDGGLAHLAGIIIAEKMIQAYEENKVIFSSEKNEMIEKMVNASQASLNKYAEKFGVT